MLPWRCGGALLWLGWLAVERHSVGIGRLMVERRCVLDLGCWCFGWDEDEAELCAVGWSDGGWHDASHQSEEGCGVTVCLLCEVSDSAGFIECCQHHSADIAGYAVGDAFARAAASLPTVCQNLALSRSV